MGVCRSRWAAQSMNALAAMFAGWRMHFSSADPRGMGTHSPNTTSKEGICTWLGENSAGFSIEREPPLYIKKTITPFFPDGTLNQNENPSELYRWLTIYQATF